MIHPNALFVEQAQIVPAFVPVNLATAANAGDWVSMKNYARCTIVIVAGAGTAPDDIVVTLQQATAVAGTGNKALNFSRIDVKQGADLATIGDFTTVTQTAGTSYTEGTSAETQNLWVIEVKAEDLDEANGFDCVQASIADVGTAAKVGVALYILWGARYLPPLSAIAD
jgi:hypothetical protein